MAITLIHEENPFGEFLKGVQPVADAWGNRYIARE